MAWTSRESCRRMLLKRWISSVSLWNKTPACLIDISYHWSTRDLAEVVVDDVVGGVDVTVQSTAYTDKTRAMIRGRIADSNLTIHNITLNDRGTYNCTATTHDTKTSTAHVHVEVYSKRTLLYCDQCALNIEHLLALCSWCTLYASSFQTTISQQPGGTCMIVRRRRRGHEFISLERNRSVKRWGRKKYSVTKHVRPTGTRRRTAVCSNWHSRKWQLIRAIWTHELIVGWCIMRPRQ